MKVKLDENISAQLVGALAGYGLEADTVQAEGLTGRSDQDVWRAAQSEQRFFITQDMDFSDARRFVPGTHAGLLVVRSREPGARAIVGAVAAIAGEIGSWSGCFVVPTGRKLRVRRPPRLQSRP